MTPSLILGTRKGLIILNHNGKRWTFSQQTFAGVPVSHATQDPRTGTLWVCADHGHWGQKLYRSDDKGATFTEIPTPRYPEGAELFEGAPGGDGQMKPATLSYLWTVVPGGNDQDGRLYIGTEPGGVFVSDDDGRSFDLMTSLWNHPSRIGNWFGGGRDHAGACSIIVDPRDSNHLFVGISVGGVYESVDGGQTWVGRNKGLVAHYLPNPHAEFGHDPHCLTASPSNPDVLWQQNHYGVYRSTDAGQNWVNISQTNGPVGFGFPIVVDAQDDQTAWVVPGISDEKRMAVNGAMCVCRTEDGGQTWQELRHNLPQENCFDIVFRHGMDIRGDLLAFGSTTGNLFVSADRGDTWECLGYGYPPFYSVRFGY